MLDWILFRVTYGSTHRVICWADTRERAKLMAFDYLGGNMEEYEVEPITNAGDTVHVRMTLYA